MDNRKLQPVKISDTKLLFDLDIIDRTHYIEIIFAVN